MGFERITIFGIVELELDASAGGTLTLSTDLPGNAMAVRETKAIPATGRRVVRFRLQGTTKGRLYSVRVTPNGGGTIRLYGGRIWARSLPGTAWEWYAIPIPQTGEWQQAKLPIPPVGEWQSAKLPIPEVTEWSTSRLPIRETPPVPEWRNVEIDQ